MESCGGNVHLNQNAVNLRPESQHPGKEITYTVTFHSPFFWKPPNLRKEEGVPMSVVCKTFTGFVPLSHPSVASFPSHVTVHTGLGSQSRAIGWRSSHCDFELAAICTATRGALGLSLWGNRIRRMVQPGGPVHPKLVVRGSCVRFGKWVPGGS